MSDDVKPHRDEALMRVGRNLVNFQRLESYLRQLVPTLNVVGTVHELSALQASRTKELKKKSLGDLTIRYYANVFGGTRDVPEPATATEVTVAQYVRVEATAVEAADIKKGLAQLVRERNRLVHTDLVSVDFNSIAGCEELSARLDEENERICAHLDYVNALRQAHSDALAELQRLINSEEFLELLKSDRDDA